MAGNLQTVRSALINRRPCRAAVLLPGAVRLKGQALPSPHGGEFPYKFNTQPRKVIGDHHQRYGKRQRGGDSCVAFRQ